jgi:hypothetical protein
MTELLNNLRSANVSLYLLKKEGRKTFAAYRLPNGIDEDIREKYRSNFEHFIAGRSFGTYDFVHSEKNALIELETSKIPLWTSMFESIIKANDDGVLLQKDNFDDDYSVIVIDFSYQTNDRVLHTYFVSKYMKTDTWYKKGVKFAFTANGVEKEKQDIIVLNGCIDVVINSNKTMVLNERNFEYLFNYYEAAKKMVNDAKPELEKWPILTSVDVFFAKAIAGKTRTLKLANALKNSKTDWSKIPNKKVREVLSGDERFATITFDEKDKIICTEANADLIIDIIREVYSKQLFTEEIIETKGV